MDPKWKAAWLEALRSGEYLQAKGTIREELEEEDQVEMSHTHSYCCLGVLSDLVAKEHPERVAWGEENLINTTEGGHDASPALANGVLHDEVCRITGLDERDPWLGSYKPECTLESRASDWNDSGHDFTEIATQIETHL